LPNLNLKSYPAQELYVVDACYRYIPSVTTLLTSNLPAPKTTSEVTVLSGDAE